MSDSTRRFSTRVDDYVKARPGYPEQVGTVLETGCGLGRDAVVADVGSGTGILSAILLRRGWRVLGVEPNADMRAAAERHLAGVEAFVSVDGTAEATTLPSSSIDLVTAGQAFHWFDHHACRAEFVRVLRPGGYTALVWNIRRVDASEFMTSYEALVRHFGTDYEKVSHHGVTDTELDDFFGPGGYERVVLPNAQVFDYDGLERRLLSSSYVPNRGHARFEEMCAALRDLFGRHEIDGHVEFVYDTKLFYGLLTV